MNIGDPNFLQIKTKRSPTSHALNTIASQKLKPYYNTVYQLLNQKNSQHECYRKIAFKLQQKIRKKIPKIVLNRRIDQQTLQFKIEKPLQKRHFYSQTSSSKIKNSKSVTKSFSLSKKQYRQHKKKDQLAQSFDTLRKISKTLSLSTSKEKKKYNVLDKWHKLVKHHFNNLQLQHTHLGITEQDNLIVDDEQIRYKLEANQWLQSVIISNDNQTESLIRKEKAKYLINKGNQLNLYKGVTDRQLWQCKQVIQQDNQLMGFSLSHKVATTNINQVKAMYEQTKNKLSDLLNQYQNSRKNSLSPRSISQRKSQNKSSPNKYKQYEQFKQSQNQNPQYYKIGDRHSNFRSKKQKINLLTKLKDHQKNKYTTKVMDINRHRKLFLKVK